jgi:hypothetical protein
MSKSFRIRTTPGEDKNIRINIEQDFDTLDILSLKLTQTDVYTSLCADFGVVVGRVFTNGGYGVPNAMVSIFVPIDDSDEDNEIIRELYPYRTVSSKNDEGYRYNLLPKSQQHSGHTPTGTFPDKIEVLTDSNTLEVYEKYYKYTAKTNESGDFMLFGVPLGTHTIHYDMDLSDIGCQSLVPFDFIYDGTNENKFDNSYTFKSSDNIDSLPQIISTQKTVNVEPFWGNPELCQVGITRSDFDLKERGVRIEPYSLFMGGTYTDSENNAVRVRCNVDNQMGEKCSLTTNAGDIEAIRFSGHYESDIDGRINLERPILESIKLDSEIDSDGNFFVRVPMNLRYMTTDEFGYMVESKDPSIGIPTEGKYRFRMSLRDDSGAKNTFRGKFLIPQIKEHQKNPLGRYEDIDDKSYAFSLDIDDYPVAAIDDISGKNNSFGYPNDYFYAFRYHRTYTVSGFINQYYNESAFESLFGGIFTRDRRESFLGIKEIQPEAQEDCNDNNQYFPITDAVPNNKFKFLIVIFLILLEGVYLRVTQFLFDIIVELILDLSDFIYGIKIPIINIRPFGGLADRVANLARAIQKVTLRNIGLVNYPDCIDCSGELENIDTESNPAGIVYDISVPDEDEWEDIVDNTNPIYTNRTFTEAYSDYDAGPPEVNANLDENLYIPTNVNLQGDSNYIIEYQLNSNLNGLLLVGYGTQYPFDVITSTNASYISNVFSTLKSEIFLNNGISGQPLDTLVANSAHDVDGDFEITAIYYNDTYTMGNGSSSNLDNSEYGCQKYDMIVDEKGNMDLKAYLDDNDYTYYLSNPNDLDDYPNVINDAEDPCTFEPSSNGILVTVSAYVDENDDYTDIKRGRRLAKITHGVGTHSGYSEFRDGVYTLVPAAGRNQRLISDYLRRKRLGKLLCSGYISYTFVNSWLNGSLYFFQFRKRKGGEDAKFCKDLIYRKEDGTGTHYYYRSTPYYNGQFIGLEKSFYSQSNGRDFKEILYPTTIVDLGPRNTFINEICTDESLDVNCSSTRSLGSTSYNDISDLMEFILQSKEASGKGRLDASDLFKSRAFKHIDGDIAQLLNYNSQVGMLGYNDESEDSPYWPDGGTIIYDGVGAVGINFLFSEQDEDVITQTNGALLRLCINGVGNLTETAQEIPYYKWNRISDGFGGQLGNNRFLNNQNWDKYNIHSTNYQGGWVSDGLLNPDPDGTDETGAYYFDNDNNGISIESYTIPPIRDCEDENYAVNNIPLGGPFLFYFGLRTGKTSWNKFIEKYGPK